ncbi:MAG: ester cyclase [Pseudomonadota bacterium]
MTSKSKQLTEPLRREHMPTNHDISLARYTGRGTANEKRIPDDFGPSQSLRGFETTYRNIVDYIVRITHRIWEDRDVEYIAQTYSDDSHVFDDYGLQRGCQKIIADTHHTTGAFSDIELVADEIVWAGNDEVGFHTSHRTLIRGTNDGDSKYGPATNKTVDVLVIANCVALNNEIYLEHVLYNTSEMLEQLGLDLDAMTAKLVSTAPAGWPRSREIWDQLRAAGRPAKPISIAEPVDGFDVDAFVRRQLDRLWNCQDYAALDDAYADDFEFEGATNRRFSGAAGYRELIESLLTAFPDLTLAVDEVYWMGNGDDGFLVSERWSAEATHAGDGLYGPATGKPVTIWGITQHEIRDGRIQREWMLFNELDLKMQITAARKES